ncbi:hypothetical protein [Acidovorax sp.]|uniref:hypothetical protein n=1 Tax=Acidovorax sp. TaxID=1872122 RepID=UPI002ACEB9FB|nr:hypothetical protein [Acidovorax sp.]MDZ7865087.1 hypothetical protein [Acidovorax sp.]
MARVRASRPAGADETSYSSEELFPYAVQVAMELGVEPSSMRPVTSVQGWLARALETLSRVWTTLSNRPDLFDSQDLVDLAFAIAQQENPALADGLEGVVATFRPDEVSELVQHPVNSFT